MPLSLKRGRVGAIVEAHERLLRLKVDGAPCVAYPRVTGPVEVGDEVLVNVQARELGLGSGGFDVLYANLTRGLDLPAGDGAHVMNLPYSPGQWAVRHVGEDGGGPDSLEGLPVVCATLHSQVAPICAGIGNGLRIGYVQVAGGALPVSLSDALRALRERFDVPVTIAAAPCFDADVQAASVASALLSLAGRVDVAVCALGPGIVGTGSRWGHGAVAAAEAANATGALGGSPILAARVSDGDPRERHRGVSHHTRAALELCLAPVRVAWPAGLAAPDWLAERTEVDVATWREACAGLPLSHMGRGPDDDPWFFATAFAAGRVAATARPRA